MHTGQWRRLDVHKLVCESDVWCVVCAWATTSVWGVDTYLKASCARMRRLRASVSRRRGQTSAVCRRSAPKAQSHQSMYACEIPNM